MSVVTALRAVLLPLAGLGALAVAVTEYRSLRALDHLPAEAAFARLQAQQPWSGLAGHELARRVANTRPIETALGESVLAWHLARAPLVPWFWYDRAVFSRARREDWARILWHLDTAVAIQPHSRELRWRVATLAVRFGNTFVAEEHLRRWLEDQPQQTARALRLASNWIPEPEGLLTRVLPPGEAYLEQALAFAHRERRMGLGAAAWTQLPRPRAEGDEVLLNFVDLALATGWRTFAATAWAESYPEYVYGQVHNGDFQRELGAERGLNWRRRMPAGTAASRDTDVFHSAPASLRVDFDGKSNPSLRQPSIQIPIPERSKSDRWKLSGYWRGEGLTTRSLPYLHISGDGAGEARLPLPAGDFDWEPFEIEIEFPRDGTVLTLQVRRDALRREFDRNIAGRLWLDALRTTPD